MTGRAASKRLRRRLLVDGREQENIHGAAAWRHVLHSHWSRKKVLGYVITSVVVGQMVVAVAVATVAVVVRANPLVSSSLIMRTYVILCGACVLCVYDACSERLRIVWLGRPNKWIMYTIYTIHIIWYNNMWMCIKDKIITFLHNIIFLVNRNPRVYRLLVY